MISAERLRSLLRYDAETGKFFWIVDHSKMRAGALAGGVGAKGYWMIGIDGARHYAHRLAWLYVTGEWPPSRIDHRDTDRLNNRWTNLRISTPAQNAMNTGVNAANTSGLKGVSWHDAAGKWQAHIRVAGKSTYLGLFEDPSEAHAAYVAASKIHHGEFGRHA